MANERILFMKVLVISDIHANIRALDTILREEADYDLLCCAGDFTDYGISPREVLERFRQLENTVLVYGNHDRHVINIYESGEWTNVTDGKYKWVHYNCERLSEKDIDWMKQLPEKAYFEADGWSYGIAHQYDNGYGTVESRYAFDQYWNASYGAECDGKRQLIFGHTHRQCIHTLGEGMEWINPGSISYRRPDDPDKTAHYAVILDGNIQLKSIAYDRTLQLAEAKRLLKNDRMMRTELQDFMFFFGDAKTSRDPL